METMTPTMNPTMMPDNAHTDIPGNPSTATSSHLKLNDRSNGKPLRVLSEDDWKFWIENGYIVIKNAVPKEQAERLAQLLWEFEEKDPNDPETWYAPARAEMKMKELTNSGMVEIYNHQYLWDNRQTPRVYDAFVDIWGTEKLWVTIDRANLNLPARPGFEFKGFIHWDYDPETKPQNVQGVLALADQTDENMGGFQCIPELYRTYDTWKLTQPADRDHFKPDTTGFELVKVKMEAGDLLIFNSTQPHGIRPNLSGNKVRIAQYISMMPAQEDNEALRQWRISSWRDRKAPEGYAFPGDPRGWEQTRYQTAELSDLGKKLLGLERW
ncbi:ectoine hydroxylase-related dioxygenase (phytanoyl-CoA dioxygenase family) [Larkinella arboricola]|uniref:Ectoine hydroxylase-related dioxygenase (Phytanoyl-CoA dioxygenase family) n=1 Tax=Larkinella arboricola TaxID=643671 RepID=A0A327XDD5_LARAB|nr:phytanoyl-CoA dioxygenase family protein [Larkinella arboricola]RAK02276.1 ectoine hydroxylase-related dioxygenase (phytanoyl-CoA dioxygenase family) [Larkinella arboricola]